jgi:hypothetical protein
LFAEAGKYYFSRVAITCLLIVALSSLISIGYLVSVMGTKKIKSRKTFTELIWTLIISIVIYFSVPSASVELIYIGAVPLSYFMSHYFIFSKKKLLPEIFFVAMFIIVAVLKIWNQV